MKAIITCVGYDDFLLHTLPRVQEHFGDVIVVTSLEDARSAAVAAVHHATVLRTPAFYEDRAVFNKGRALDEALRDASGWVCVLDADIILPAQMDLTGIATGNLYSPYRRLLETPGDIPPEDEWPHLEPGPEFANREYAGYFHLFHMNDMPSPPWYESEIWTTAQGCDSMFTLRWSRVLGRAMHRLPFEVLHLGTPVVNWHGRKSERWD